MRFVPPEQSCKRGTLMSVLRILSTSASLAKNAPKVEEKTMGAKFSAMFTQDGAIGMLMRRVQPYLRDRAAQPGGIPITLASRWQRGKGYSPPDMVEVPETSGTGGVARDAVRWALPNFENTDCSSRTFPLSHHLGGEAGPWGGPNLERTNLAALVDQPMAELGLEKYFQPGSDTADVEAVRISALESESTQLGSLSGLPFDVGQHAAATTPIARQTLQRLKSDVKGAVEKIAKTKNSTELEGQIRAFAPSVPDSGRRRANRGGGCGRRRHRRPGHARRPPRVAVDLNRHSWLDGARSARRQRSRGGGGVDGQRPQPRSHRRSLHAPPRA